MHQPVITDAATLRGYCQDLAVSKFLSGLSLSLRSQVRGQILRGDITLTAIYFRVMRVSTGDGMSFTPAIEQPAMASGRGRGRSRGRVLEDDVDPLESTWLI